MKFKQRGALTSLFSAVLLLAIAPLISWRARAETIAWANTMTATAWYTSANWSPGRTSGTWVSTDVAQFNNTGTATSAGINLGTGTLSIGAIEVSNLRNRALAIGSSSSGSAGVLRLNGTTVNGTANVILRTAALNGNILTLQNNVSATGTMSILLGGTQTDHVILMDSTNVGSGIIINTTVTGAGKKLVLQGSSFAPLQLLGANTYSGGTSVAGANQLRIGSDGVVSAGGTRTSGPVGTGTLTLGDGASLRSSSGGATRTIQNNLSLSGAISLGATTNQTDALILNSTAGGNTLTTAATVTLSGNTTLTTNVNTTIANAIGGAFSLTKNGTGSIDRPGSDVLILSGVNTYSGPTAVNAGTLVVGLNGIGSITSDVAVASGATLAGSGIIHGDVSLSSGATLAPGNSPGLLTVDGDLILASGSIFSWELASQTTSGRGTNFDAVNVTGSISGSDAIIRIIVGGLDLGSAFWDTTQSWQIYDKGLASGSGFGQFQLFSASNLTTPVSYSSAGSFSFDASSGALAWNAAVPAPEPGGALASLLMIAGLLRRQRTRPDC